MAANDYEFSNELDAEQDSLTSHSVISIEQLQRLVQALDNSDVSELELQRESDGVYLALRKVKASETNIASEDTLVVTATNGAAMHTADAPAPTAKEKETGHKITAPLVGTFHVWARPRGGALVAVGDRVKAGQLVGTIQSLNVLNEVETTIAGRVVEVHVQDGQPVEYGQVLMTIDSTEGAKKA
ncbi:MAG TPA: biotin/lipoyl-containing protein [Ktedonobacteraceae bacterium]|nr:biotin/lipoyl-containing protein [Ktedonobacteraceae bacterium]